MKKLVVCSCLVFTSVVFGQESQDSSVSTFTIFLSPESCTTNLSHKHLYEETVDPAKGVRIITANSIPEHKTGEFPNQGNPNTIKPQQRTYEIPLNPLASEQETSGVGMSTGILFSGVELDPYTGEFFKGKNGENREWNSTTLSTTVDLGLDCNNAHVQPSGKYHYHGTPNAYLNELGVDGTKMIKVGYAADGFPIYYKYAYNESGEIQEFESGFVLKEGDRPGDGVNAPNGQYDGTYFQDYEYKEGISELDKCNGRIGKTPDSESEYYYLITDNFPSVPIYLRGTPSEDFKIKGAEAGIPGTSEMGHGGMGRGPGNGQRPEPTEIMKMMDTNRDDRISREEARGPLQQNFERVDQNQDGFISLSELKNLPPPGENH